MRPPSPESRPGISRRQATTSRINWHCESRAAPLIHNAETRRRKVNEIVPLPGEREESDLSRERERERERAQPLLSSFPRSSHSFAKERTGINAGSLPASASAHFGGSELGHTFRCKAGCEAFSSLPLPLPPRSPPDFNIKRFLRVVAWAAQRLARNGFRRSARNGIRFTNSRRIESVIAIDNRGPLRARARTRVLGVNLG